MANEISEGDFVIWVNRGVIQWNRSRRLVKIETLAGVLWGFCDGSLTAVRLDELQPE